MRKNTYKLENVKDYYKKKELESLNKMYSEEDFTDKYILFVQCELYFPFLMENMKADIDFIYDSEVKNYKNKLRTPYPNKNITMISMVNGRKVCNSGIPLIFDSYDDLKKLKSILVKWKIDTLRNKNTKEMCYIQVLYDINFEYIEGKRIYSIFSKDMALQEYRDKDILLKYLKEFSKVAAIKNVSNSEYSIEYIKGEGKDKETLQEECFITIMENMKMKDFLDSVQNNKNFIIFSYYAKETLIPNDIAENIPHF